MATDSVSDLFAQRLANVFAALSQLPDEQQLIQLRLMLLNDVDRLEAEQLAQLDLLRDCLFLAANNMQDARLHILEQRVSDIENPEPRQLGEYIIEAVLILVVELSAALAPHLATAVLASAMTSMAMVSARSTRVRRARVSELFAKAAEGRERASELTQRGQLISKLLEIDERQIVELRQTFVNVKSKHAPELWRGLGAISDELAKVLARQAATESAIDTAARIYASKDAATAAATSKFIDAVLTGEAMTHTHAWELYAKIRETSDGRIGEAMGQLLADKATAPPSPGPTSANSRVFLSSHVLESQLDGCRQRRVDVLKVNARLRHAIAEVSFDQLLQDTSWHLMIADLAVVPVVLEAKREPQQLHVPSIVQTAEALLWYEWLSINGALHIETSATHRITVLAYSSFYGLLGEPRAGTADGDHWLLALTSKRVVVSQNDTVYREYIYRSQFYPGLSVLSEYQAGYLYERFARHLPLDPKLLPFDLAATDFGQIGTLAKKTFWGSANAERDQLLAKQKMVVITAFNEIGLRLKKVQQEIAREHGEFDTDDLSIPFLKPETDDNQDPPDESSSSSDGEDPARAKEDLIRHALELNGSIRYYELLRTQIEGASTSSNVDRQKLHNDLTSNCDAIQVLRSKVGSYLSKAKELGVEPEALAGLEGLLGAGRFDLLMRWQCGAAAIKWKTMSGPFGTRPTS